MIVGVGSDICDLRRIAAACTRHDSAFARRILHSQEWQVYLSRCGAGATLGCVREPKHAPLPSPRAIAWLGTRFSAKEALSKALGLGLRAPFTWHSCAVLNSPSGQPVVQCYGALLAYVQARQLQFHISLSDERDYACSFVVASRIAAG